MSQLGLVCRTPTPFKASGELDEEGIRRQLARLIDSRIGVYSGSAGIGEGHALTPAEMKRVWQIVYEECHGKVYVVANPPDQHRATTTLEQALLAVEAGCDVVNIYTIAGWHGMRPTDKELRLYYDFILPKLNHPVALSVNPVASPPPPPRLMADVVRKYPQVVSMNLMGVNEVYLQQLKDLIDRPIAYYVIFPSCQNSFSLGAAGLLCPEANIVPKSYRSFIDAYEAHDAETLAQMQAGIIRLRLMLARWEPSIARWAKMSAKLLKLPGGEGGLREPYQMPDESELEAMAEGFKKVGLPELDELCRAAGL